MYEKEEVFGWCPEGSYKEWLLGTMAKYPTGYRPEGIWTQVVRLCALFPQLSGADERIVTLPLPAGAEGWFAIPRWERIASTYSEAVEKMVSLLRPSWRMTEGFGEWCPDCKRHHKLGPSWLRQQERTVAMLEKLGEEQEGHDILVVPAQFGLGHRGRSVRRAREVFAGNEFGLGAFAVGCMLLTHPERFVQHGDLSVDCAGDEFSDDCSAWAFSPYFGFTSGVKIFQFRWWGYPETHHGTASGFLVGWG
ncbi:MAG: hypothetical protein HY459_01815 [Parcubacteria group bacterium]|nr:hypothetical protein [Parcubacteria group bacterium]